MTYKDVILKYFSHISPYEIAKFIGIEDVNDVENLSEEIKDVRISDFHADFVLKADKEIIHVEFQQEMTPDDLNRFFVYNALLTRQFNLFEQEFSHFYKWWEHVTVPVKTYVIYLGRSDVPKQIIQNEMVKFEPGFIKVSQMDSNAIVEHAKMKSGNMIEMILMPLMKNCNKELITELIDEEAKMNVDVNLRDDVLTSTLVITATVYERSFIDELKRRLVKMYSVDIFEKERKEAIEQGLQQGLQQGIEEGKLQAMKDYAAKLLIAKFKDKYIKELKDKIQNADSAVLDYIISHIFDIDLEELKKIL
ncbi:MAG: hypothetical protein M1542_00020 [Thermotogae bacterium]|jgi:hypothetical protein|nr:hypothetical protein [Thermotogota bacterium]